MSIMLCGRKFCLEIHLLILLRNSIKTQLPIVILRNEVTKDLSFRGFKKLLKKDPSLRPG